MEIDNNNWQQRTELLLGQHNAQKLHTAHILVVGLGGVGAVCAEMLCRAGVGKLTIVDADTVSPTNINRQLIALTSTVGRPKVQLVAERLRDINPSVELTLVEEFIKDEITDSLLDSAEYTYVADCIDTLAPKVNLIIGVLNRQLPLVSSMGAGAKLDPTAIEIKDIKHTHHCPLAHMLRKRLHKQGIRSGFQAVFSAEEPIREAMVQCEEQNKKTMTGTISYLPMAFGCAVASAIIRGIISR